MSWEFKVGQKVVCVDASGGQLDGLTENNIYVIRSFDLFRNVNGPRVRLIGIVRPIRDGGYKISRFRPLVTDTQSWLKEILETPPKTVRDLEDAGNGRGLR